MAILHSTTRIFILNLLINVSITAVSVLTIDLPEIRKAGITVMNRCWISLKRFDNKDVTEVHIVGGVHPSHDLYYYGELIRKIKQHRPSLHIKAFSAIELDYMITKPD